MTSRRVVVGWVGVAVGMVVAPAWCQRENGASDRPEEVKQGEKATEETATDDAPDWLAAARWYSLEVDRFYNGDPTNDPPGAAEWTAEVPTGGEIAGGAADVRTFGGDLQGLRLRIGYLKDLAVNAVILDPIFHGCAGHPRRVAEPRHIDDAFAVRGALQQIEGETDDPATWKFSSSDRTLLEFIRAAHDAKLRVVLSGLFGDIGRGILPPELSQDRLLAVTKRWMDPDGDGDPSDGVDGWVVSMPVDLPQAFWTRWRKQVKKINPNAALILSDPTTNLAGATGRKHQQAFDAVFDVKAAKLIGDFFRPQEKAPSGRKFLEQLREIARANDAGGRGTNLVMLSGILGPRAVTLLSTEGPSLAASAFASAGRPDDEARNRWRLATIVQHFIPGAPVTYYGDETGMYGMTAPAVRPPMWWKDPPGSMQKPQDYRGDLFGLVRWLHDQRDRYDAVREGGFEPVLADDERRVLVFSRKLPDRQFIVAVNYSDEKQKIMVPAGEPGMMVGLLSPQLRPPPANQRGASRPGRRIRPGAATPPDRQRQQPGEGPASDEVSRSKGEAQAGEQSAAAKRAAAAADRPDYSHIRRLRMGGSRQFVNAEGKVTVWVSPMSVRIVLVDEDEPWR